MSIDHTTIISTLKQYAPYPMYTEIGIEFYEDHLSPLIIGTNDYVMIDDVCRGFFHTHPIDDEDVFSMGDMELLIANNMPYGYLGHGEHLYFLEITPSIRYAYEAITTEFEEEMFYNRIRRMMKRIF